MKLGKEFIPVTISKDTDKLADSCGWVPGQPVFAADLGDGKVTVQVKRILNGYRLSYRGVVLEAHVYTEREAELAKLMPEKAAADTSKKLLCPMPGLVIAIPAVVGQEVKAGEPLAIVEAMKMENILRAERDVTIKSVNAKTGRQPAGRRRHHGIRMSVTALHVIVEGRVQGVGFRAYVEREAKERGLKGWVRNRSDGRVEAVFSGEEEDVQSMIVACHRGPRMSLVRDGEERATPAGRLARLRGVADGVRQAACHTVSSCPGVTRASFGRCKRIPGQARR